MKNRSILFWVCFTVLLALTLCACQADSEKKTSPDAVSSQAVKGSHDIINTSETELVVLGTDSYICRLDEERIEAVNSRLAECGCDFRVKFIGLNYDDYDEYQGGIDKRKRNGIQTDLIFTGFGDGDHPEKEPTYDRNIRAGNLLKLDRYLGSEEGKELKEQYTETEWDCVDKYGGIYGINNSQQKMLNTYLIINANAVKEEPDVLTGGKPDWSKLRRLVEEYRGEVSTGLQFDWDSEEIIEDTDRQFGKVGYERVAEGFYARDGKFVNIWEEEWARSFWSNVHELSKEGLVSVDGQFGRQAKRNGDFVAAVGTYWEEDLSEHVYYTDSVGKIPVYRYEVAIPRAPKVENIVTGVASWTKHRRQALRLLTLLNCDEVIANLMVYGIEGRDYRLSDGYVGNSAGSDEVCMVNTQITYPSRAEQKDKREVLRKVNERFQVSEFEGFTLQTKKIRNYKKIVKAVDGAYLRFLSEEDKSAEEILSELDEELKALDIDTAIAQCKQQYKKWKSSQ